VRGNSRGEIKGIFPNDGFKNTTCREVVSKINNICLCNKIIFIYLKIFNNI